MKKEKRQSIDNFLRDSYSKDDYQEVVRRFEEDREFEELKSYLEKEWISEKRDSEPGISYNRLHHRLLQYIVHFMEKKRRSVRFFRTFRNAAAILLIPALGFLIYLFSSRFADFAELSGVAGDSLEIIIPIGSQSVVYLSDGTEVYLNHGSKLKYPQKFGPKNREVVLSGEGFFNIAHHAKRPFTVKTGTMNITALGTSFNVMAYPGEDVVETTLVEGKVAIRKSGDKQDTQVMVPGQHTCYHIKNNEIFTKQGDIERYIAWKDGKLIFKNESLTSIADRLSRWYNVDFEFKDETSGEYTYTATFVDQTLFQILDLMTIATPVTYSVFPRTKLPDGTLSRQKIIIQERL